MHFNLHDGCCSARNNRPITNHHLVIELRFFTPDEIKISNPGLSSIGISLDWKLTEAAKNHKVVLKLQRCYVQIDLDNGKVSLPRGVQIDSIEMSK